MTARSSRHGPAEFSVLLGRAIERRRALLEHLHGEGTDCYRLLHGVVEGRPGTTVDRYGPILLYQTWGDPVTPSEVEIGRSTVERECGVSLIPVWNDRREGAERPDWNEKTPVIGHEIGLRYDVTPRHRGRDPLLFLDFRAGRRKLLERARDKTVLNLFAYTGGAGLGAIRGGASEVWNVDFSRSAMQWCERNLALNAASSEAVQFVRADVLAVLRQLAGLPLKGRGAKRHRAEKLEPRCFDLVVLDPPRWSKSPFGAVDVVRDYPSLLKPALLATAPGGELLVTNNAARVDWTTWVETLRRTGDKCGRPLECVERLEPEDDFPTDDGEPPLKLAWLRVREISEAGVELRPRER